MIVRSGRLRMESMPGEAARLPPPLPVRFGLTVATSNVWQGASAPASINTPTQTAGRMIRGSIYLRYTPGGVEPKVGSGLKTPIVDETRRIGNGFFSTSLP